MDSCFLDISIEFLSVAFHNILYYSSVYPKSVFETRKKYNVVVYSCIYPDVKQYIDLCLKSVRECMKREQLNRVVFIVTNSFYEALIKFVFDIYKREDYDENTDAYLIQVEQNLRAFCLNLSTNSDKFKNLPEDCSFTIQIHTNESTAVAVAANPELEDFPLVEVTEDDKNSEIVPLRSFPLRTHRFECYIEL